MFGWFNSKFNSPSNDMLLKGKYRYDEGKYDEALKLFDEYTKSKPKDLEGWYWKAITLKLRHPNEWYNKYNCSLNDYKEIYSTFKNAFGSGLYYDEIKQNCESLNKHIIYRRSSDKVEIEPLFCNEFSLLHKFNVIKIKTKTIDNKEYPSIIIGPLYDVLVNTCPSFLFKISYCPWCREHLSKDTKNQNHHFLHCRNRIKKCNKMSDEFRTVDSEFDMFLKFDKILRDISFCPWCNAKIEIIENHNSDSR